MKEKLPAIHIYIGDWLKDEIAGCSLEAQGLWLRLMFIMHESERYGYLCRDGVPTPPEALARRCGCTVEQYTTLLAELFSANVPSKTPEGIIHSRRMVRDAEMRQIRAEAGKKGGRPSTVKMVKSKMKAKRKQKAETDNEDEVKGFFKNSLTLPENLEFARSEIEAWIAYKRERGEFYRPLGLKALLSKLSEFPRDRLKESIVNSMASNWAGIFLQKEKGGEVHAKTGASPKPGTYDSIVDC